MEHPFEAEREYQRALNAVKLERVFAKPFLGSLDGHRDGLTCVSKHPNSLSTLCSSSADGEVRVWHLTERKCLASWQVTIFSKRSLLPTSLLSLAMIRIVF